MFDIDEISNLDAPIEIVPEAVKAYFEQVPGFPLVLSHQRCGGHYLRFLMELYFERPGLCKIFCYHKAEIMHVWSHFLVPTATNILFLYRRSPLQVVQSHLILQGKKTPIDYTIKEVLEESRTYAQLVDTMLFHSDHLERKEVVIYENLIGDPETEFQKVCRFFDEPWDVEKFRSILPLVTVERLGTKSKKDQIINLDTGEERDRKRAIFEHYFGDHIREHILDEFPNLKEVFSFTEKFR